MEGQEWESLSGPITSLPQYFWHAAIAFCPYCTTNAMQAITCRLLVKCSELSLSHYKCGKCDCLLPWKRWSSRFISRQRHYKGWCSRYKLCLALIASPWGTREEGSHFYICCESFFGRLEGAFFSLSETINFSVFSKFCIVWHHLYYKRVWVCVL